MRKLALVALLLTGCAALAEHDRAIYEARAKVKAREDAALSREYDRYVREYGPQRGPELWRARYGR